jgi:hypothetical protein
VRRALALLLAALATPALAQSGAAPTAPQPPSQAVTDEADAIAPVTPTPAGAPAPSPPPAAPAPNAASPPTTPSGGDDDYLGRRIGESYEAAESLQGPLDGAWTLVSASGDALYAFELVDKAGGRAPLEGAWRDLRRPAVVGDIGMIDSLARVGQTLAISFAAKDGAPATTVSLTCGADGVWSGELNEAGTVIQVRLRRS